MGAVSELVTQLKIPYYIHERGLAYLNDDSLNLARQNGRQVRITQRPELLRAGHELVVGATKLEVRYTPGHSFDSVTYYDPINKLAFVGDLLYNDGPGIWQFPGGNRQVELASIKEQVGTLLPDVLCFLGHTRPITVATIRTWDF